MSEFNKRIEKSVAYIHDQMNHKPQTKPITQGEVKDLFLTVLSLIKEDDPRKVSPQ